MQLFYFLLFFSSYLAFENTETLSRKDRIFISEASQISDLYGSKLWENWNSINLIILLIKEENEYLINHPAPGKEFRFLYYDSLLHSDVYYRKRIFEKNLLSSFPVNGVPVIAAGLPENTGKTPSEWIIAILHEHFHQIQYSQRNYYEKAGSLDLSGGDNTGMWMLNYPFPYDNNEVEKQYETLRSTLLKLIQPFPNDGRLFNRDYSRFVSEMLNFKKLLNEKDYKYFQFQLWQEGIARYTEYKIADALGNFRPPDEFESLVGYKPFSEIADSLREGIYTELEEWNLKDKKRLCFYSFGASLGLLLDRIDKNWKEKYFHNLFSLEQLILK
ncbi:MAG TPA: hypothetical protein VMT35_04120 [Ignavibacteriaceae bacterium]|nr:hypothetical protein [Ignavibacteriaceae bacterium]